MYSRRQALASWKRGKSSNDGSNDTNCAYPGLQREACKAYPRLQFQHNLRSDDLLASAALSSPALPLSHPTHHTPLCSFFFSPLIFLSFRTLCYSRNFFPKKKKVSFFFSLPSCSSDLFTPWALSVCKPTQPYPPTPTQPTPMQSFTQCPSDFMCKASPTTEMHLSTRTRSTRTMDLPRNNKKAKKIDENYYQLLLLKGLG
jgi:hypothetical protein